MSKLSDYTATSAETSARSSADSTLQTNLNLEATARANSDSTLQTTVSSEATARINSDSTLTSNLGAEISARTNSDSTLTSNLSAEISARTNSDSTLTSNLSTEITARTNSDSTLTSSLAAEITSRLGADSTLTSNLNAEVTARINATTIVANVPTFSQTWDTSTVNNTINAGYVVVTHSQTTGSFVVGKVYKVYYYLRFLYIDSSGSKAVNVRLQIDGTTFPVRLVTMPYYGGADPNTYNYFGMLWEGTYTPTSSGQRTFAAAAYAPTMTGGMLQVNHMLLTAYDKATFTSAIYGLTAYSDMYASARTTGITYPAPLSDAGYIVGTGWTTP